MSDTAPEHPGQWRLAEVQLYNWGTFSGLHRLPIARKGHLITGPSGSGKSSLLDAIAAVLTPDRWLRFNDAAQGAASPASIGVPRLPLCRAAYQVPGGGSRLK